MQRFAARVGPFLLLFLVAAFPARAQTGTIAGRVTERQAPAAGVTVTVSEVGGSRAASAISRDDGRYTIANLTPGTYRVRATRVGIMPTTLDQVVVRAGETATADLEIERVQRLTEIVTTASRGEAERLQEVPAVINVVNAAKIAETPAATAADVLKAQPALSVIQSGLAGFNIVSRGFNNAFSTSMLMLQDYRFAGVPSLRVNVPFLFTGTNDDIERIEVMQGPAAALYGPNSGNGVLHVITKSPFDWQGTTVTLDAGERSFLRGGVRHSAVLNDRVAFKISGEALTAKDYEYVDPNEPLTWSATDTRIPAERRGKAVERSFDLRKQSAEARLDLRPSDSTLLVTSAGWSNIGSGREITTTFGAAQVKDWSYLSLQQRFQRKRTFAQVFFNRSNSGNENGIDASGTYYLRTGIPVVDRSSVLVGQVQQGARLWRTDLLVGGEYIATRPQTEGTINGRNEDDDDINEYGGYLQTKTSVTDQLELLLAARGDVNSRIEGAQFSPRAALMFKPDANNNFRVTFNRAFNSPASFSFFLDQYSGQTPAPGMPVQIFGNPAKEGWTFARTCTGGAAGDLCMRSPYIPNTLAPASAAAAYPGFAAALPQIVQGLPVSSFGAGGETARAQLLGLLNQIGPILRALRPTSTQVGTVLMDLGTRQPVSAVTDYDPLGTGFANTWEVGYKGIVKNRLRFDVAAWWQRRPADPSNGIVNPGVLFNPQQLGAYLGTSIAQALIAQGMPAAQAQATATQAAGALTPLMAAIPVGATAFTNSLHDQPFLVFTYRNAVGYVNVAGQDLSADLQVSDNWFVSGAYSHLSDNVFADAPGATAQNPLAANTPKHRASAGVRFERYQTALRGFSAELRGRYADAFPVNSGVLNSYGVGTPVRYEPVPVNAMLDANVTWRLPLANRQAQLTLNATNLLDNKVRTFVGVPEIGRMLTTRLQYTF